jgi:thiosulfate/3-mercaptopyruvate sulfurtransferase
VTTPLIRPARRDDVPVLAQIWYDGWCDAHLGEVPEELVAARTRASFDERTAARVADTDVVEVDGVVRGLAMVHDDEVEQVFLAREARGSGVAALLLDAAERRVRGHGHERAWLAVVPGNGRARAFYARRGWHDEGDLARRLRVGDGEVVVACRRYTKVVSPLIGVTELSERLDEVTLLDVRYRTGGPAGPEEHAAGHVPGAAYVDLDSELAAAPGRRGRHPLPDPDVFVGAMQRAGVSSDRPVVVYDDWAGQAAARCWWLLPHHGHPDVRVLDGGWSAWTAAGLPTETGEVAGEPGTFEGPAGSLPVVEADAVPRVAVLVDARAGERFRGETEPIDPVAGHVPGAVNVPTSTNLRSDGTFRPAAQLAALYAAVGATPGADVAAYCGSGVTACHDVLAMEVAGVRAALYPGSWSEWVADPTRPVETG